MRGRAVRLSVQRRMMIDLLYLLEPYQPFRYKNG
jgi:hypothetical protein